ncbi:hypothetical protein A3SI_09153 [Nitritalea halalkaliphila LW7]|uniref:Uncharacterized protein n=1 Tax=Nitritalea halalkaliphila LW7 TaxID=1189621 RepID=I5C470_9BACT|nr:hypothetical protein A3SI_09153 [Nitritalea halalkaliphila LW7]
MQKLDLHLFFHKVYPSGDHATVEAFQVFEEPDAGGAVDQWDGKGDVGFALVFKVNQLAFHLGIEEVVKAVFTLGAGFLGAARLGFQRIVGTAHIRLAEDLIDELTSRAAKVFFCIGQVFLPAALPAVVAGRRRGNAGGMEQFWFHNGCKLGRRQRKKVMKISF